MKDYQGNELEHGDLVTVILYAADGPKMGLAYVSEIKTNNTHDWMLRLLEDPKWAIRYVSAEQVTLHSTEYRGVTFDHLRKIFYPEAEVENV
jgi:hypothetical protein